MGIDMWWHIACDALRQGKRLAITYDGCARIVEVHAVGLSTAENPVMRVWQVSGGSASREHTGWKLLRLDKTWRYAITEEISDAPRPKYKHGDRDIAAIRCQI